MSLLEYLLIKCLSADRSHLTQKSDPRILSVCEQISKDLSANHSIAELADTVFLSVSRLSHLFRQQMGISLLQWRENQRILEAQKLLCFSSISINSIAKSIGYDDALYFSKIFKKHTACSPSEFREKEHRLLK